MEAKMDLTMFKEIPGYKAILKAVLKAQMQMLVDQLSEAEEETVILTASLSDGTLSYLGSQPGKTFLDGREEIKSQFLFHCLKRKTSTPTGMPTPDPRFIAGQAGTTMPNQEPVFIPGGTGPGVIGQDQMFTDLRPHDSRTQHDERPAKKPRRTLPEIPSLFGRGTEMSTEFESERVSHTQVFERGMGGPRGTPFGPSPGMGSPRGGPFGRGGVVGRGGSSSRGGRGLAVGRGSPSGRGAGSGRGRRPRGQFTSTRSRGRGVRKPSATATITSPDQNSVSSTGDLDNINKTEPDLVTVKAENFEVSIDLNAPVVKHDDTPVNIAMSPSVKLKRLPSQSDSSKKKSTPKKLLSDTDQKQGADKADNDYAIERNDSVGQETDAFNDSTDDDNDGTEGLLNSDTRMDTADSSVNDSNVDTEDNGPNVSHLSIKQEVQDVEELLGMEARSLLERYGEPGPSGDRGSETWGIMKSGAMGSCSFDGGTPGSSQRGEEGSQSSSKMFNISHYSPLRIVLNVASPSPKSRKRSMHKYQSSKTPKTRAEIQRAYRDRKKAAMGQEYYETEKERVRNYYHRIKKSENQQDVIKREENRKRCREAMRAYRDKKRAEKLLEMEQLAELEEAKQEAITAIEESELTAESEEDESFLDEATGLLENVTAHGDKTEGPGQAVSDGSESDQNEKETDQNVTL